MAKKTIRSIHDVIKEKAKADTELLALGACLLSVSYRKNNTTNQLEPVIWLQRSECEKQAEYETELQKLNEKYNVSFVPMTGISNVKKEWSGRNGFNNESFIAQMVEATQELKKATAEKLGASATTTNVPGL